MNLRRGYITSEMVKPGEGVETQENANNSRASTGSRRGTWSRAEGVGLTVIRDSLSQELLRPHIRFLYFQGLGKMFQTFKSWRAGYEGRS